MNGKVAKNYSTSSAAISGNSWLASTPWSLDCWGWGTQLLVMTPNMSLRCHLPSSHLPLFALFVLLYWKSSASSFYLPYHLTVEIMFPSQGNVTSIDGEYDPRQMILILRVYIQFIPHARRVQRSIRYSLYACQLHWKGTTKHNINRSSPFKIWCVQTPQQRRGRQPLSLDQPALIRMPSYWSAAMA